MLNPAVTGFVGGHAGYASSQLHMQGRPAAFEADVAAVRQLLNEWLRLTPEARLHMAPGVIDRLKLFRERTGDAAFKNNVNKLIHTVDAYVQSHTNDSPKAGPGRDMGHRHMFHRPVLRNPQRFDQQGPAQRASHHDFYTARSNPGKRPGVGNEPGNIWSGFKQGPNKSNCATVASIKIAMMKFGQKPADIFKQVTAAGDGWNIQMRDDRWYHLSRTELAQATYRSEFSGDDPSMVADANFLYAVSAKRAQLENNDGYAGQGFESALYSINDGEPFGRNLNGLLRLGLRDHIRETSVQDLARGQLGLVTHGVPVNGQWVGHALAVINGREEVWGRQGGRPPANIYANALALI
ncbi:hypothetical protein VRB67_14800 [Pseudomonas trivialis]|uniref:hypothetical protein n=1 Tax=Pseudomonas trivialis TaxID=200450 RepID=UPI0030CBA20E